MRQSHKFVMHKFFTTPYVCMYAMGVAIIFIICYGEYTDIETHASLGVPWG